MDLHLIWLCLLSLRFLWALLPQYGYIHPDEFFQTVEVVAGDTFNTDVERTWEFNSSFPIRSILIPKLLFQPAFKLLQIASENVPWVSLSARRIVCVSRLVMVAQSLIVDLSVMSISSDVYQNRHIALVLLSSSYGMLVYLTHSFSNSIEAVLFSVILAVIVKSVKKDQMFLQEKEQQERQQKKKPKVLRYRKNSNTSSDDDSEEEDNMLSDSYGLIHQLHNSAFDLHKRQRTQSNVDCTDHAIPSQKGLHCDRAKTDKIDSIHSPTRSIGNNECVLVCIIVAVINTAGLYNRPTFVLFTAVPFLWWLSQIYRNGYLVYVRITIFIIVSFLTALMFSAVDTIYYRNLTWNELLDVDLEKWFSNIVITPMNFVLYNSNVKNLEHHGKHPFYLHFLVNLPLLFGPLVFFIFRDSVTILRYSIINFRFSNTNSNNTGTVPNIQTVLLGTIVVPVFLLSIFPHQEPRFLIPLLPVVIIYTVLTRNTLSKKFYAIFILFNFTLAILYGILHQGGLMPCIIKLHSLSQKQNNSYSTLHVLFSHTYMPPKHPLLIQENSRINIHDLKGAPFDKIQNKIFEISIADLSQGPGNDSHKYLVIPWNVLVDLQREYSGKLRLKMIDKFFPHLSLDHPPTFTFKDSLATMKNKLSLCLMKVENK